MAHAVIHVTGADGPGLRWLLDILIDVPARGVGPASPPTDGGAGGGERRVLADLAAVPDAARCRFVLPAGAPRIAARSLRAYNALRPRRVALSRAALAVALRAGAARALLRHRVVVTADARATGEELADAYLLEHLRRVLDVPVLHAAIGISTYGPFAKPTLQLFDGTGRPLAYVKVGWNPATRRIVAREAEVLATWEPVPGVVVPRLLDRHTWRGRVLAITAPLPAGVRRVPPRQWPCLDGARAIAGSHGLVDVALGATPLIEGFASALEALASHPVAPRAAAALDAVRDLDEVVVPHGPAHGDWVPWNLARDGDRLVAWDWEHALDLAPLGFDLAHWAYQQRVVVQKQDQDHAFDQVVTDLADVWPRLGLSPAQASAVAAVHRVTILTREALPEVAAGDAGGEP